MKKLMLCLTLLFLSCNVFAADKIKNLNDPYESYNRFMFNVNDKATHVVFKPISKAYRFVTPKPIRTAIGNFFDNFRDVTSIGSNLLRGNIKNASSDLMRVGLNSTFGLLGFIDIATPAGLPNNKNTLGDTFASWGWKNSNYFVYPLLGPSTVRDAAGTTASLVLTPEKLVWKEVRDINSAGVVNSISAFDRYIDLYDNLYQASIDPYAYIRDGYMDIRMRQVGGKWPIIPTTESEDMEDTDIDQLVPPDAEDTSAQNQSAVDAKKDTTSTSEKNNVSAVPSQTEPYVPIE